MGKVLLTIGHVSILLPDERGVATIMATLSRGAMVHDALFKGEIELYQQTMEVGMKIVPNNVRYIDENKEPITAVLPSDKVKTAPKAKEGKAKKAAGQPALSHQQRFFLGNGRGGI